MEYLQFNVNEKQDAIHTWYEAIIYWFDRKITSIVAIEKRFGDELSAYEWIANKIPELEKTNN
jgi:hypothetical protein